MANNVANVQKKRGILLTSCGIETYQLFKGLTVPAKPVFSFCKMAAEQTIVLLASKFEGRGAQITHKFLTCFYSHIILRQTEKQKTNIIYV